jgi:hypothetical protein
MKPNRHLASAIVPLLAASSAALACSSSTSDLMGSGGSGSGSGGVTSATGGNVGSGGAAVGGAGVGGSGDGGSDPGSGGSGGLGGADGGTSADGGTDGGGSGGEAASGDSDVFGITELYPSAASEALWTSEHWTGGAYSITDRADDNDPLGISGIRGNGTLDVTGTGELVMGGSDPRIYVYEGEEGPWRDIEVTVYYQRVEDEGTAYAGLVVGVRSGPDGHTSATPCDAHTYYARLRHDGAIDFEKELEHPASATQSRIDPEEVWPPDGELPTGQWIGWKFVIYNLTASSVQLEAYRDLTEGQDGGDWQLMNETVDDGGWSVETNCAEHSPTGGESDLVVVDGGAVLVRNTDITEARYRWMSIREIAP